jgi:hypothetical protein
MKGIIDTKTIFSVPPPLSENQYPSNPPVYKRKTFA